MQLKKLLKRNRVTVNDDRKEVVKVIVTPFRWLSRLCCRHETQCLAKLAELGFRNAPQLISSTADSLTMRKVDGASLRCRQQIDEQLFLRVMEVVRALHGLGFAHGNLRPNNIFISHVQEPILIDFETCLQKSNPLFLFAWFRDHLRLRWLWQSRVVSSSSSLTNDMFPRCAVWAMIVVAPLAKLGLVYTSVRRWLKKSLRAKRRVATESEGKMVLDGGRAAEQGSMPSR